MNRKTKSFLQTALVATATLAILIVAGWWILHDLNSAPNPSSSKHAYRSPWAEEADNVPLAIIPNSPAQPAPMPKPVSLDNLQPAAPMPSPQTLSAGGTATSALPGIAVLPQDLNGSKAPAPVSLSGGTSSPMPQVATLGGASPVAPSGPALAVLSGTSGGMSAAPGIVQPDAGVSPAPQPVAITGALPDNPAAASHVSDTLQRQIDALANDDDLLDPGEKARRFVMSLCRDQQGRIWVGCEDSGVWRYDPSAPADKQWTQFTRKNTGGPDEPNGTTNEAGPWLGDDNGYALACDKLGRIWVGHLNHGVSVYNGQSWRNYGVLEGPLGERVFAITTCPTDGDVWIATSAGLTRYSLSKDTWSYYTRAEGLPSDQASALAFDQQGNLIVGTQCDGLAFAQAKDDYKTWRQVTCPKEYQDRVPLVPKGPGLPTNLINDVLVAHDGTIYVATTTGLAWSKDQGQSFEFVRGKEWAEKVKGLYGGAPEGWQAVGAADLQEDHLTKLAEDDSGNIGIGSWRKGYGVYNPQTHVLKQAVASSAAERFFTTAILTTPGLSTVLGSYGNGITNSVLVTEQTLRQPLSSGNLSSATPAPLPKPMAAPSLAELKAILGILSKVPIANSDSTPSVVTLNSDWTTRGNWLGRYGRYWACLAACVSPNDFVWGAGAANVTYRAKIGPHHDLGDSLRYWVQWNHTTNPGSLELPMPYLHSRVVKSLTTWDVNRRQSEWDDHSEAYSPTFDGPNVYCTLTVPAGLYFLSLYSMNKDGHNEQERYRDYGVSIREHAANNSLSNIKGFQNQPELANSRIRDFWGGIYTRFLVRGPIQLTIQEQRNYSYCTILAGVMLDPVDEYPSPYFAMASVTAFEPRETETRLQGSEESNFINDIQAALVRIQKDNPTWHYSEGRQFYAALVRWYGMHLATIKADSKSTNLRMASCYYQLGLYDKWERVQKQSGIIASRQIEKALRWDGQTTDYTAYCFDLLNAYHKLHPYGDKISATN